MLVSKLLKVPFYYLYLKRLRKEAKGWKIPKHVGIIMDGNRRYARYKGVDDISIGHRKGAEKLEEVLSWCMEVGIKVVTVWSFSLDNFRRPPEEVAALFQLFEEKIKELKDNSTLNKKKVRVKFIGEVEKLPPKLQDEIAFVEERTGGHDNFFLNIAIAYGGREEVVEACKRFILEKAKKNLSPVEIANTLTAEALSKFMYTSDLPEPDLIIRTSGEVRLSGFLLWQSVYSEFYFCDTYWPEFREIDFLRALRDFDKRQRRFGR